MSLDSELDDGEAWAFNAHGSMAEAATNERRVRDMPKMLLQGSANPQLVPIHSYGALGRGLLSAGPDRPDRASMRAPAWSGREQTPSAKTRSAPGCAGIAAPSPAALGQMRLRLRMRGSGREFERVSRRTSR